jgi:uncharacterized membrane protein
MSKLVVIGFKKDRYRASKVLNELENMGQDWAVDLHDAVAVYRDYKGKLRMDQSLHATAGEGALLGGLWGSMIGAILAIPITAGLSAVAAAGTIAAGVLSAGAVGAGAAAIDAKWWKDKFGIPEDFVQEVGSMLQPYDSAIFALLRTAKPNEVIEHFRGYGGSVLETTLTRDQEEKLNKVLQGGK